MSNLPISQDRREEPRTINLYNTASQPALVQIQSTARTWGQLLDDMNEAGIDYDPKLHLATESITKRSLSTPAAQLPEDDTFIIAITVRDTEGGRA